MQTLASRGQSSAAQDVEKQSERIHGYLHQSNYLGQQSTIRGELGDVWNECRCPDWDGYGAMPVNWAAVQNANRLLLALPWGTQLPSVGAVPSGDVTVEWHHSRRRTLTVTLTCDGELHYAALLGPSRTCGTEPFDDQVPATILMLIARVYEC